VKVWNADDLRNLKIKQTVKAVEFNSKVVDSTVKSKYSNIYYKKFKVLDLFQHLH